MVVSLRKDINFIQFLVERKEKIASIIFSFSRVFSPPKVLFPKVVNSFSSKRWFLRIYHASLLKTLWEKEKLLVMSNFSFFHCVFYPFGGFQPFSSNMKLSHGNSFSFEESEFCRVEKGLKPFIVW